MTSNIDPNEIFNIFNSEFNLNTDEINSIIGNQNLDNKLIKKIFKILINYTYKLKKSELALDKKYENNFEEINNALKELKEEMKKIIKEPPPEATPS
jgi:uncharacterized protein (DUF885 family)